MATAVTSMSNALSTANLVCSQVSIHGSLQRAQNDKVAGSPAIVKAGRRNDTEAEGWRR